jgi:hypothetical protein
MEGGIFGALVLIADIWAILNVVQSRSETVPKVLWIAAIILLPVLGFVAWLIAGPRQA